MTFMLLICQTLIVFPESLCALCLYLLLQPFCTDRVHAQPEIALRLQLIAARQRDAQGYDALWIELHL